MKTVIIYDQCGADSLKFYLLDGDYKHLDGIYVNNCRQNKKLVDELCDLFYDSETGQDLLEPEESFPIRAVKDGALVIVAGFLP